MSLLVDMMTNSLDLSYAEAASRRVQRADPDAPPQETSATAGGRRVVAILLILALGTVTGIASGQVRRRQAAVDQVRSRLVADVRLRVSESDRLARQAADLRAAVDRDRSDALASGSIGRAAAQRLAELELAAAVAPVVGSGLIVHLDDAAGGGKDSLRRGGHPGDGRVLDRDLQAAVNGLWAAGAEAMAVDGLRLTARTAIRSAGDAILVDYRPLTPPYVLRAVGEPRELERAFLAGSAGRQLAMLSKTFGLRVRLERTRRQILPAPGLLDLRLARPVVGLP